MRKWQRVILSLLAIVVVVASFAAVADAYQRTVANGYSRYYRPYGIGYYPQGWCAPAPVVLKAPCTAYVVPVVPVYVAAPPYYYAPVRYW